MRGGEVCAASVSSRVKLEIGCRFMAKDAASGVKLAESTKKVVNGVCPDMKVYIGQINPTVGALTANAELIRRAYDEGVQAGADVVLVPELAVTGYPPRDLLDRKFFIDAVLEIRDALVKMTGPTTLIFGCPVRNTLWCGKPLHNAAIVARNGKVLLEQHKNLLPTYDVFDELRYFEPARNVSIVEIAGRKVGVSICEDFWYDDE